MQTRGAKEASPRRPPTGTSQQLGPNENIGSLGDSKNRLPMADVLRQWFTYTTACPWTSLLLKRKELQICFRLVAQLNPRSNTSPTRLLVREAAQASLRSDVRIRGCGRPQLCHTRRPNTAVADICTRISQQAREGFACASRLGPVCCAPRVGNSCVGNTIPSLACTSSLCCEPVRCYPSPRTRRTPRSEVGQPLTAVGHILLACAL
jgi:hypothetical protein